MSGCGSDDAVQLFRDALEALPEAIAIFDRDDRFVFWNRRFAEIYGENGDLRVGTRFEDHLRASLARGQVPAAAGREDAWLAERLARFAAAAGAYEHRLADGRHVRVQDRCLAHGGRIGIRSDVTEATERERSFRLLFDANPVPMIVSDLHTYDILAVNDAAVAFYGHPREAFLTLTVRDIRPERAPGELEAIVSDMGSGSTMGGLRSHRTASGEERLVQFTGCRLDYGGRPALLGAFFDLTEQHRMAEEIRHARAFLTQVVDEVPTAVFAKDMAEGGRFVIYNRTSEALFGRSRGEVIGRSSRDVFGPEAAADVDRQDRAALRIGAVEAWEDEVVHRPDGTVRSVRTRKVALAHRPGDAPRFVLGVSEDVTERLANEARIAHMAHHDALTDLPNRFLFHDRLASALARGGGRELLAVLFLDLDGFKAVNDTHGHAVGDGLLIQVADRLRAALRSCDTAARFGGDEFAVLLSPMAEAGEAAWLAARLVTRLSEPYAVGFRQLVVSASIGVALSPLDAAEPAALLEQADDALYRAKREGRNTFRFAAPEPGGGDALRSHRR